MAEEFKNASAGDLPVVSQALQSTLVHMLNRGKQELEDTGAIVPFTGLLVGEQLFIEQHVANTPELAYAEAKHTVECANGAQAYGFCYDGYIDTNEGVKDAVIAEGGVPGDLQGHAIGYIYTSRKVEDKPLPEYDFDDNVYYIGPAANFMIFLEPPSKTEAPEN